MFFKVQCPPRSQIKKEFKDVEAHATYGYPEGQSFNVQTKARMDQDRILDWVFVWEPYNKGSRHDGRDAYLLMDEFSVHLM
jgi:hypothetical protein